MHAAYNQFNQIKKGGPHSYKNYIFELELFSFKLNVKALSTYYLCNYKDVCSFRAVLYGPHSKLK